MKYPKPWDAGSPAGKPFVASVTGGGRRREGESNPRAGLIQFGTYVNRPGTSDHSRLVRTWLSLDEALRLVSELNHHIELVRKFNDVAPNQGQGPSCNCKHQQFYHSSHGACMVLNCECKEFYPAEQEARA